MSLENWNRMPPFGAEGTQPSAFSRKKLARKNAHFEYIGNPLLTTPKNQNRANLPIFYGYLPTIRHVLKTLGLVGAEGFEPAILAK
jgi:hypothetical protein